MYLHDLVCTYEIFLYDKAQKSFLYAFVLIMYMVKENAPILIFNDVFIHSKREAVDEVGCVVANDGFPTFLFLDICGDLSHLLQPVSHKVDSLLVASLRLGHPLVL